MSPGRSWVLKQLDLDRTYIARSGLEFIAPAESKATRHRTGTQFVEMVAVHYGTDFIAMTYSLESIEGVTNQGRHEPKTVQCSVLRKDRKFGRSQRSVRPHPTQHVKVSQVSLYLIEQGMFATHHGSLPRPGARQSCRSKRGLC